MHEITTLTIADLHGIHGHLEEFEPEPACGVESPLAALLPIQRVYRFERPRTE